jgi:hypothetical protein
MPIDQFAWLDNCLGGSAVCRDCGQPTRGTRLDGCLSSLSICLPHIVDKRIFRKSTLIVEAGLPLPLPIRTVVKPGLLFDLLHSLGIVLGHPAINVGEKSG